MTLCSELMNNLDGITSALVALQLLSLCLPPCLMSDMALLSWPIPCGFVWGAYEYLLMDYLFYEDKVTSPSLFYWHIFSILLSAVKRETVKPVGSVYDFCDFILLDNQGENVRSSGISSFLSTWKTKLQSCYTSRPVTNSHFNIEFTYWIVYD